jgi:hypothetical protein
VLSKFSGQFNTSDNQFGFKPAQGCGRAIYTARTIIDAYVEGGDTAHLRPLDISKALDKVKL